MTSSKRKLIGTLVLLIFLIIYVFAAMGVAMAMQVNSSRIAELAYYIFAGTLWVPVACWVISWMHKEAQ